MQFRALNRASDISQEKKQNFAGFSGANSQKNWPISRDFHGKKVKIRGTIGRFQAIFAEKKPKFRGIFRGKFAEKSADFAGFSRERSQNSQKNRPISRDFTGKKSNFEGFSGANA